MKDNAVNSNKQRTRSPPLGAASLVHVAGMGGICSLVVIKIQLIRLSNGMWRVGDKLLPLKLPLEADSTLPVGFRQSGFSLPARQ